MPGITGAHLAADFKTVEPECRIIGISGHPDAQLQENLSNFDALLVKPVEPATLIDCLTALTKSIQLGKRPPQHPKAT